jgi:hypothetical protein
MLDSKVILLDASALSDGDDVAVTLVEDGHATIASSQHRCRTTNSTTTYPTRKSFPAAVPRATLVPEKWCTVVLLSMA